MTYLIVLLYSLVDDAKMNNRCCEKIGVTSRPTYLSVDETSFNTRPNHRNVCVYKVCMCYSKKNLNQTLYLIGVWFDEDQRTNTIKMHV
jgi:hypothetical protein